ncbi:glycosyltransferase family 4 protein [Micromonospora sp. DSM 115977]|uniref:Glycosyltransferase family 4 protein n=1 Tax=Micromonospora reichwaldensis TaxID=3075516 RepID=A0ABU2WZ50_9ACTN|nr:glycosyltransferase family 4 protein [Micromonospora sp. DSM 115977]MDT0530889.1 glycosyltransferase family 4 protein [Micromonospora sp. DSM 115977]
MNRPLRVALVSPLPPPQGGIARWTRMIDGAARDADAVDLVVVDIALRGRSIHQTRLFRRVAAGAIQIARSSWSLAWEMVRRRPDVVHVNTSGHLGTVRDLVLLQMSRAFGVPFVYHIRFGRVPQIAAGNRKEWRLMRRVIARAAAVVVLDERTERAIRTYADHGPLLRIPNCIDTSTLPQPSDHEAPRKRVLFAGWVIPAKGVEDLLSAWSGIDTSGWELVVAGPCESGYLRRIRPLVDGHAVRFPGELGGQDLLELMATCEVFVLPSHSEGFPNAILEAMALGRAVIATDVGAVGDMLSDGCGVVVPPREPDRLATALAAVMGDPACRVRLGERARAKAADEYALPVVFDRYEGLWRRVSRIDDSASADTGASSAVTQDVVG